METNNRILKVVLAFVAISVAIGFAFAFNLKLENPLFFHHYYDQRVYSDKIYYQDSTFKLDYITNYHDDRVVIDIEFLEYPDIKILASEYGYSQPFNWGSEQNKTPGNIYGLYSVRNVNCKIIDLSKEKDLNGIVLTKAKITFSDSSEVIADIGEIHLYEAVFGESPLEHISSSGSSDGTGETRYRILEDITITAIDSLLMEKFKDRVQYKVNGINPDDSVEMTFKEGDFLEVKSEIGIAEDIVSEYTSFDICPRLAFADAAGKSYSQRFYNINNIYHNYSFIGLYRYVKESGAI